MMYVILKTAMRYIVPLNLRMIRTSDQNDKNISSNQDGNEFRTAVKIEVHPQIHINQNNNLDDKKKDNEVNYNIQKDLSFEVLYPQIKVKPYDNLDYSLNNQTSHHKEEINITDGEVNPSDPIRDSKNIKYELRKESLDSEDSSSSNSVNSVIVQKIDPMILDKNPLSNKLYQSNDNGTNKSNIKILATNLDPLSSNMDNDHKLQNISGHQTNFHLNYPNNYNDNDILKETESQIEINEMRETDSNTHSQTDFVDESLMKTERVSILANKSLENLEVVQSYQEDQQENKFVIDENFLCQNKVENNLTNQEKEIEQNSSEQNSSEHIIPENLDMANNTHSVGPFHGLLIKSEAEFLWLCVLVTILAYLIYYWKRIFE